MAAGKMTLLVMDQILVALKTMPAYVWKNLCTICVHTYTYIINKGVAP